MQGYFLMLRHTLTSFFEPVRIFLKKDYNSLFTDFLTTSSVSSKISLGLPLAFPIILSNKSSAAFSPISYSGICTVVKGKVINSISSNPMMEISSGTCRPFSSRARIIPTATKSLYAIIAVGKSSKFTSTEGTA